MKRLGVKPGDQYDRVSIIREVEQVREKRRFLCRCDCGAVKVIKLNSLRTGKTKSCGCLLVERRLKHGFFGTKQYTVWHDMKQRCLNPNEKWFKNYGARGITICKEWLDPKVFCEWALMNGYQDNLTIERIDNNGNYCPENCKWIPGEEQHKNTRRNRKITFNGKTQILTDWARELKISCSALSERLKKWGLELALQKAEQATIGEPEPGY